ncbi:SDR family oxidoreductase [Treponema sp. TIM-1]|uniref:SDR family oxidoreductase n=1 Tax=Treponema sp. TIM-1 TaxID=2898417 RepID=UPI0039811765
MLSDMRGKAIIITGGAGGIGRQTAIRFMERGANVCISDIDEKAINTALDDFKAADMKAIGIKANVTDRRDVARVVRYCIDEFGGIDILVNVAGIYKDRFFIEMTDEEWNQTININLGGVYNFCKETVGIMAQKGYGRIINISSQAAISGSIMHAHYAAAKAAIIGLSCTLAKELAPKGINVNCVAPGIIETNMTAGYDEVRKQKFLDLIPLKRFGSADDVAQVIVFLASDAANYMTGQTINVTGGWLMHS